MISEVDVNGDGKVDFDEFLVLMAKQLKREFDKEEELVEVFKMFDIDGDGRLSAEDIIDMFRVQNEELSLEDATKMIKLCDKTKKDHLIQFSEFVKVMMYDLDDPTVDLKNY